MSARPLRGARRWLVLLPLQLAACALALLLAEGVQRLRLRFQGRPYDAAATREALLRAQDHARNFVPQVDLGVEKVTEENPFAVPCAHPFTGWDMVGGYLQVDRDLAEVRSREQDGVYDVLIVGGSVSAIFGEYGAPRLGELLAADPRFAGREVRFLNYGRGAFKQPQHTHYVLYLLALGIRPDAVLLIDGFNEVALGNNNVVHGASPYFPTIETWLHLTAGGATDRGSLDELVVVRAAQEEVARASELALRLNVEASAVLGPIALSRVQSLRRRGNEAAARYSTRVAEASHGPSVRGPKPPEDPAAALAQAVRAWKESSFDLQAICRGRGIDYLHVLQPTLHDAGSKPVTEGELRSGGLPEPWMQGVVGGYPLLRAAGAELVREGVSFVDLSGAFADHPGTLYFDGCHFDREGNDLFAERIAPALLEAIARGG